MVIFRYVLFISLFFILAVFFVDLLINGITWIKRLKIGCWKEEDIWYQAVYEVAGKWFFYRTPTVKKTDQTRYILKDIVKGNYKNKTIQSWQLGGLYLGLSEKQDNISNQVKMQNKVIDKYTGNWKVIPNEVDSALLAYAILKKTNEPLQIKKAMDFVYDQIVGRVQKEDGCVCYRASIPTVRFVDTIGFICPFLALYGKKYNKIEAIELSLKQIKTYYEFGILTPHMLAVHAYEVHGNLPLGIYGWGRGNGWWLLGLIDTYLELPEEEWLQNVVHVTANEFQKFQTDTGGFSSVLPSKNNMESSITAIAAYYYSRCYEIFHDEHYNNISQKCILALMRNTRRNGEIDFSQGDTKGIGIYSQQYDIMPFTQGMALRIKING